MSTIVAEVLAAWRDGERLLDELPPLDPDRETLALAVAELRTLYARLTDRTETMMFKLDLAQHAMGRSLALIGQVRGRHGA